MGAAQLRRAGVAEAERNADLLLAHVRGCGTARLALLGGVTLDRREQGRYQEMLAARASRRPLQHLVGEWEFLDLTLEVTPAALIPRPETEILVEAVLARLPAAAQLAVDVGTGGGCIALALAAARPRLRVLGIDRSSEALALAGRNRARAALGDRIELLEGDLLAPLGGRVERGAIDAIVANPPYVPDAEVAELEPEVREHEPWLALAGGADGLEVIGRLVVEAAPWLPSGGLLAMEVGAGQAEPVVALLAAAGDWSPAEVVTDLSGIDRAVLTRRL